MQQHLFEHFQSPGHTSLVEDIYVTFIDTTDPFIPTRREDYWEQTLKTLASHDLNTQERVYYSGYICCSVQIIFNTFDARPLVLGLRF